MNKKVLSESAANRIRHRTRKEVFFRREGLYFLGDVRERTAFPTYAVAKVFLRTCVIPSSKHIPLRACKTRLSGTTTRENENSNLRKSDARR